jgi:hypothetical protein
LLFLELSKEKAKIKLISKKVIDVMNQGRILAAVIPEKKHE